MNAVWFLMYIQCYAIRKPRRQVLLVLLEVEVEC